MTEQMMGVQHIEPLSYKVVVRYKSTGWQTVLRRCYTQVNNCFSGSGL